jgi:hypothetical protein
VVDVVEQIVAARSKPWNPLSLSWNEIAVPPQLSGQPIQTSVELASEQAEYSRLHLLAQNIFLVGFYHGASVSDCLSILGRFSGEDIVREIVRNYTVSGSVGLQGDLLSSQLQKQSGKCKASGIAPELMHLRSDLQKLLDLQQKSKD